MVWYNVDELLLVSNPLWKMKVKRKAKRKRKRDPQGAKAVIDQVKEKGSFHIFSRVVFRRRPLSKEMVVQGDICPRRLLSK